MKARRAWLAFVGLLLVPALSSADPREKTPSVVAAEALFQKLAELERRFDPAVADLYADDALIKNRRLYPTGEVRELQFPAPRYKALLAAAMPLAKERGDASTYSDIKYEELEDGRVRISCTRFSELKEYASPYRLVVQDRGESGWLVVEELSESRP